MTTAWRRPASGRCRMHATLGHDALPLACRQFPRVTVEDPRGVSVTLSHYCPTAAGLLERDTAAPFTIVLDPPAFPAVRRIRRSRRPRRAAAALAPRHADGLGRVVGVRATRGGCVRGEPGRRTRRWRVCVALSHDLESWQPADGPLLDRVREAFRVATPHARPCAGRRRSWRRCTTPFRPTSGPGRSRRRRARRPRAAATPGRARLRQLAHLSGHRTSHLAAAAWKRRRHSSRTGCSIRETRPAAPAPRRPAGAG